MIQLRPAAICRLGVPLLLGTAAFAGQPATAPVPPVPLASMQRNGSATMSAKNFIQLSNGAYQVSSAFVSAPYALGPTSDFGVAISYESIGAADLPPADGLALVMQSLGPSYLGLSGSGLGFFTQYSLPAIAVTVDYFANSITGSPANTVAIATPDGTDLAQAQVSPAALSGSGARRYIWFIYTYANKTVQVYYSDSATRPSNPILQTVLATDLATLFGGQFYVGVTAGTGEFYSTQALVGLDVLVVNKGQ